MHETIQPWQRAWLRGHRSRGHAGLASIFTAVLASAALVILMLPPSASATSDGATYNLNVPATADIFASGMTSVPGDMEGGAGTLPVSVAVNPGLPVRFPSVSGLVNPFSRGETEPYYGADGRTWGGTWIAPYGGISGVVDEFQLMFLVGVFTDGSVSAVPPPPSLDFSEGALGHAFTTLAPELGQVFFIGDGRAGLYEPSGALQTFVPPAGATTLFLGFADAWAFAGWPGWYDDNVGSLSVSVEVTSPDTDPPSVTVTGVVDGATYTLGAVPTPGCHTEDAGSGVATEATLTVSAPANLNGVGSFTARCGGATDQAGNQQSPDPVIAGFTVQYSGLSGILQPINPDNTSIFKRGQAVPVKFRLAGDEPLGFNTDAWTIVRQSMSCDTFDAADSTLENVGSNTPYAQFRYDGSADQYVFNADMRLLSAGTCWKFRVTLDSGQVLESAVFKLAK